MNLRQKRYKYNRMRGMNQYNAAKAAGYSESYSRTHNDRIERATKSDILDALEQAGITDKFIAERLYKWADSENGKASLTSIRNIIELRGLIVKKNEHTGLNGSPLPTPMINVYNIKNSTDQPICTEENISSSRCAE